MMKLTARSHTPKGRRARDRILVVAEALLATHGFYGTSMRDVAAAARLPLATVVYHFARKERLYAAVLGTIADDVVRELEAAIPAAGAAEQLDAFATALVGWMTRNPQRVLLMSRELLDNPVRIERVSRLLFARFLDRASELVAAAFRASGDTRSPPIAMLHLIGGVTYILAARPTLERMGGSAKAGSRASHYPREAIAFARRTLGLPVTKNSRAHRGRKVPP